MWSLELAVVRALFHKGDHSAIVFFVQKGTINVVSGIKANKQIMKA